VHVPFSLLGLPTRQDFDVFGESASYQSVWGKNIHAELGMQYRSYSGFAFEWGAGLIAFQHERSGSRGVVPMVGIGVGWYFMGKRPE
jgi:hypothetical protein